MTIEEHLRMIIGDQTIKIAQLLAELDVMKAQIPKAKAKS